MELSIFLVQREQERDWHFANGFGNGDPTTNGEYLCVDYFLNSDLSLFLDVGANRGMFSERALRFNPDLPLQAFEPNPQIIPELQSCLSAGSNTCLHQLALDETGAGEVSFYVHPVHHETSSLSPRRLMTSRFQAAMQEVTVPLRNLDAMVDPKTVTVRNVFLKIDTEGHEAGVMRGGRQLLHNSQQCAILFEYSFAWIESGETIEDAFQFLDELGFDFYRVLPVGLEHLRFITRDMANVQYCNYLAIKGHDLQGQKQVDLASPLGSNRLILL
ncbi:MAG: hypothetical protein COA47_08330 [Robiginitomaculum sp.]|nr:MAG: hypothetical protein COA47_08330 [Robiginitomaculum sp.]